MTPILLRLNLALIPFTKVALLVAKVNMLKLAPPKPAPAAGAVSALVVPSNMPKLTVPCEEALIPVTLLLE